MYGILLILVLESVMVNKSTQDEKAARQQEYQMLDTIFDDLFPLLRSITGPGIEASLNYLSQYMPLTMEKVATGTNVFDWEVPKEWHCRSATLIGPDGQTILDIKNNNLHIVNYSISYDGNLSLDELQAHLHSLPHLPTAVPYVTSYYNKAWGFCLSEQQRASLKPGNYTVNIDTEFVDGGVPFSQFLLPGDSPKEVLLSSYLCHPSLANNELSGPLVLVGLYLRMLKWPKRRYSYRFLLNPETIGSLCFLYNHGKHIKEQLISGLILTCLGGDQEKIRFKHSRMNSSLFDRCAQHLERSKTVRTIPFCPTGGSDERQFCSPGFNLPMLQVAKTFTTEYEGYHNSLDTKEFMSIESVQNSIDQLEQFLLHAELCGFPINQSPFGEPQLGKRNLYPSMNAEHTRKQSSDSVLDGRLYLNAILLILNNSDGKHDLFDIAKLVGCDVTDLYPLIERLESESLIKYGVEVPHL